MLVLAPFATLICLDGFLPNSLRCWCRIGAISLSALWMTSTVQLCQATPIRPSLANPCIASIRDFCMLVGATEGRATNYDVSPNVLDARLLKVSGSPVITCLMAIVNYLSCPLERSLPSSSRGNHGAAHITFRTSSTICDICGRRPGCIHTAAAPETDHG